MNITEALEILGIVDTSKLNNDTLSKRFKTLMRQNHPDVGGNEERAKSINQAYGIAKKAIKKLQFKAINTNETKNVFILKVQNLIDIYRGKKLEIRTKNGKYILDKGNLRNNTVVLLNEVSIVYRGRELNFEDMSIVNFKNEYTITCKIEDYDTKTAEDIIVKSFNKNIHLTMNGTKLNVIFKFDSLIQLVIHIERTEVDGQ